MSHKDYSWAVYIGRFQPFHLGHEACVDQALKMADRVLILVGSAFCANTPKNPFTFEERVKFIRSVYPDTSKVVIEPLSDYLYNDSYWVAQVQSKTSQYFSEHESVCLVGDYSDGSSYYLKYFPQWDFIPGATKILIRATDVRARMFSSDIPDDLLNPKVAKILKDEFYQDPSTWHDKTTKYQTLVNDYNYLLKYNEPFKALPFPVPFITGDATVICSGHVLVIERGRNPGKGLIAVPGGFLKPTEHIQNCAVRELREETGIQVDKLILQNSIAEEKVFDHPERSLRGRIVTHNYLIRLKDGKLPEVKGSDDANKAFWMPLNDVFKNEHRFFDDHFSMLVYFILGEKGN